jgi:hypothetical protein
MAAGLLAGMLWAPAPAMAGLPPDGVSASQLTTMFNDYGDAGGHWTGGDSTASVMLPDGRVVWLFSDSYLGTVNADHSRPASSPMVNNVMVVQDGLTLTTTLDGGTAQAPEALVKPTQPDEYFWVGDAVVEGGSLKVIYQRLKHTGTGSLDFTLTGISLATFALPGLTLTSVVDLPLGSAISWGSGIFIDGAYTYIYGLETVSGLMRFAHLARVPTGGLSGAWQFWTGSAWSADPTASGRLISGVDGGGVQKVGSQYVWVTHENNLMFDSQVVAYTSSSPTGPFTGPIELFTAPETQTPGAIVYDARVHPEMARSGKLLVSYNVNSLEPGGTLADVRLGRPRFVELDWPRPVPGPGLPAAPSTPMVVPQGDVAQLSWPAVSGATSYAVYQRDVTAGQTHFARLPVTTQTSLQAAFLYSGHTYEFNVTATNSVGEGPPSTTVSVTPSLVPPPAPSGVTAVADDAGAVAVGWTAVPGVWGYRVQFQDVTAGQTDYSHPVDAAATETTHTFNGLQHNHRYNFVVTARHGGGESPYRPPRRASPRPPMPMAP